VFPVRFFLKAALSGLLDTDAYKHIVSLPLSSLLHLQRRCIPYRHGRSLLAQERTIFSKSVIFRRTGSFTCPKAGTWDRLFYVHSKGRHAVDFSNRKYPTASVGSEPAMLGTVPEASMQTPRPPKPVSCEARTELSCVMNMLLRGYI
jgi:hypothetical protein